MTEIEFLTPEAPQTEVAPAPDRWRPALRQWAGPGAVALWALAALLAVLAPFHAVYHFRLGDGLAGNSYRPDGWGRLPIDEGGATQHGLRYGIVVMVAAGLLVLAAALVLAARVHPAERNRLRVPLAAAGAGLGAVFVLGGVVAEVLLAMQSLRDNFTAQLLEEANPSAHQLAGTIEVSVGAMVWLMLLAVASGVAALVATGLAARPAAQPLPVGSVESEPVVEDELADEAELI